MSLVIRNADLGDTVNPRSPWPRLLMDVRLDHGVVVSIGPSVAVESGDDVIDAAGGALLPGLHDHHLHLAALAASLDSVRVGPPEVRNPREFRRALQMAAASTDSWVRAVGYHESVSGALDRAVLDATVADRPVRVQHRSGAEWVLNSRGVEWVGLDALAHVGVERDPSGRPTGRVRDIDTVLRPRWSEGPPDLVPAARRLSAHGVTGITDATPYATLDELAILADPGIALRVMVTGSPAVVPAMGPELVSSMVRVGPAKIVVADHALPDLDDLVAAYRLARQHGRTVAVHCVTRIGLLLALAAWDDVGAMEGDRIEHGAVIDASSLTRIAELGLVVVTQPNFVAERGDRYLDDVDRDDVGDLYRCGSLLANGVRVGGSTDAPFGAPDPWAAMRAAVSRRTSDGRLVGPEERVGASAALRMFLSDPTTPGGPARRLEVGQPADLCLLDRPVSELLETLSPEVRLTVVGGRIVHRMFS